MPDFNILCAGGCGAVQAYTDKAENVARHKLYCPACAAKIPRPMITNKNPKQEKLDALVAKVKADGTVTPTTIEELTKIIGSM